MRTDEADWEIALRALSSRSSCVVAALASASALLVGCSSAAQTPNPASEVKLSYCGGGLQVRPSVIGVICATNSITARNLNWSAWGKPISSAIGTAVIDLCAYSDCHTGRYRAVSIVLIASRLVTCGKGGHGTRAYSTLQYVFVGRSPYRGIPKHMNFSNFMFGYHRPSPGSQMVRLTC